MNGERAEKIERGLRWRGLAWLALCGPWFFIAYGFCNWFTAHRTDVGTWYFEWEKRVPFVPELVVPYWSLDLLFIGAFFLPRTRAELRKLGTRIFTLITLTCVCFLLWPLKFDLPRPMPAGWTAPLFRALYANDLPYNLSPSLHIGLRCLFWITYGRHLRGWPRSAMRWWFILIGASTLLVWQHHFIDIVTGFLMAYAIVALLPDHATQPGPRGLLGTRSASSQQLALRYGGGALVCTLLALPGGAWLWFGWPAIACALTALAYATANPRWLQKCSGNPTPAAEWILLPVTLIARLWQMRWLRRQPAWHEVAPGVFFGRQLTDAEAREFLATHPNLAVIDLTAESKEATPFREQARYFPLPVLDLTDPDAEIRAQACAIIRDHLARGPVFIHCLLGLGRSAHIAAAWLLASGRCADADDAVKIIRALTPGAVLEAAALPPHRD
ncbi:MAG: phosphatase PAP2/dual specificity phosphatase family protein [Chthoniobacteraceae bacterium]